MEETRGPLCISRNWVVDISAAWHLASGYVGYKREFAIYNTLVIMTERKILFLFNYHLRNKLVYASVILGLSCQ